MFDGIQQVVKNEGEVNITPKSDGSKENPVAVTLSNDPKAKSVRVSDKDFSRLYPYRYHDLVEKCKKRYKDFSIDDKFQSIKKSAWGDKEFCYTRQLYPDRVRKNDPRFYSKKIFRLFDQHYEQSSWLKNKIKNR